MKLIVATVATVVTEGHKYFQRPKKNNDPNRNWTLASEYRCEKRT